MAYDRNNVFARILRGELPCTKVYEDEHVLAFRDINPQAPTHVVLIPKGEYASSEDFSATASDAEMVAFVRAIGRIAAAEAVAEGGYRLLANHGAAAHQDVPHFHMHIVPRTKGDGLKGFFWPRRKYRSPDEIDEVLRALRAAIARVRPLRGD